MSELRVPATDLVEEDEEDVGPGALTRYQGQPFTGVSVETTDLFVSEYRYLDGRLDGRSVSHYKNGQLMEDLCYRAGRPVGEDWRYFPSGAPRAHERHDPPRVRREWSETGVLLVEHEYDARIWRRFWADGGALKLESRAGTRHGFARDGSEAFVRAELASGVPRQHTFDGYTYALETMAANLEEMAVDRDLEHDAILFVHHRLFHAPAEGAWLLRRLLLQPDLWIRKTAIYNVRAWRVHGLRGLIAEMVGDERVPPRQPGRAATKTIGEVAREVLEALDGAGP
jgi:hypothetical protein